MNTRRTWTAEEIRALGARTDLVTACEAVLGIGKTKAWEAFHSNELPFPTVRCGRRVVVPVRALLDLLLIQDTSEAGVLAPAHATDSQRAVTDVQTVPAQRQPRHDRAARPGPSGH